MSAARPRGVVPLLVAAVALGTGCVRPPVAELPQPRHAYVAVLSGEMPGSFRDVARHAWIVASTGSAQGDPSRAARWRRYEWAGTARAIPISITDEAFTSDIAVGDVALHGVKTGSPEEIGAIVSCLERETARYQDFNCGCWPGPNSNTFADLLIRRCGLGIELPATALGKDYRGPVGVSVTEARTGVQLQTWVGGVRLGLKEGVQADLAGLTLGVHFWPPGLEVPVNPGRLGFDTSSVRPVDPRKPVPFAWPVRETLRHRFGVASIAMIANYSHVANPAAVAGLTDRAVVGLGGRAVYGKEAGLAFGFDLEAGVSAPLGFAYRTHLHPLGLGVVLGDTGFLALTSGVGTSGASSTVTGRLELPQELRVEVDFQHVARLGLRGGLTIVPDHGLQRDTFETFFGTTARLGTRASGRDGAGGGSGGLFLGLERRQVMRSYWLGATFGYELGAGG